VNATSKEHSRFIIVVVNYKVKYNRNVISKKRKQSVKDVHRISVSGLALQVRIRKCEKKKYNK
jgi:hypothetical protein